MAVNNSRFHILLLAISVVYGPYSSLGANRGLEIYCRHGQTTGHQTWTVPQPNTPP